MIDNQNPARQTRWLPIERADKSTDRIYDYPGMPRPIGNSEEYWCRAADGRVFLATWADDGKRAYWWDLEGESPVDPIEFMPHPLDPRYQEIDAVTGPKPITLEALRSYFRAMDAGDVPDPALALYSYLLMDGFISDEAAKEEVRAALDPARQTQKQGTQPTPAEYVQDALENDGILYVPGVGRPLGLLTQSTSKRDRQRLQSAFKKGVKEGRRIEREAAKKGEVR